jgi:hypothetical protein
MCIVGPEQIDISLDIQEMDDVANTADTEVNRAIALECHVDQSMHEGVGFNYAVDSVVWDDIFGMTKGL